MNDDLISRQAAIDAVIKRDANCGIDSAEVLRTLPSAEKKGKWERSDDPWKAVCSFAPCKTAICSVCKLDTFDRIDYAKKHYKFCPFCGAKMEVSE